MLKSGLTTTILGQRGRHRRALADARLWWRAAPALLAALALLHGLLYAWLIPPWQTPDEPAQFEYAALIGRLGRVPGFADSDAALDRQILDSLLRQRFFSYLLGHAPQPPPQTMEAARALFFMPRQVGTDPPLYFLLAAVPLRLLAASPIEAQLLVLRLLGILTTIGAVLCIYGLGRELLPGARGAALAAALLVALQPMFSFIGVGAGNDSLANLIGAALGWMLVRALRLGLTLRRAAGLALLLALGLLTKRTLLPAALLVALLGLGWASLRLARWPRARALRMAAALLVPLLLLGGAWAGLARERAPARAADWVEPASGDDAERVLHAPRSAQAALVLPAGRVALQALPDITAEWAQNQVLQFQAHVWSDGGRARGLLAIDFGWAKTEIPFETSARARTVVVQAFIPLYCPYIHVALRADSGLIYADRLVAASARRSGLNLLSNGDATAAGFRPGARSAVIWRELRVRELAWIWRSGRLLEPPPLGWALARIMFGSFWGQFGWMSLPIVSGTPWEGALALLCLGGGLGLLGWLARPRLAWQRRAVGALLLLILLELLLALLNAYTQPRSGTIQQGRYLFPALGPLMLLLVLGWRALLPPRWRRPAWVLGIAFAALFACTALLQLLQFYQSV